MSFEAKRARLGVTYSMLLHKPQDDLDIIEDNGELFNSEDIKQHYDLLEQIGEPGNFGYAVKALHRASNEMYACKIVKKNYFKNEAKNVDDFRNEVNIMRKLKHPHVIEFKDAFEDEYNLYLVLELCEGGELFERINNKGSYSEKDARDIIKQLLEAIHHMHRHDIAHCDLKPDNFLFKYPEDHKDGGNLIKMIDFGLSKFMKSRQHYLTSFCGTPFYIAPEVLKGKYNQNCDLWSIGVVTFVLLFGYPPFYADRNKYQAETDFMIFEKIKKGFNPIVKAGYGSHFPKDLPISEIAREFISGLLETQISKRFSTTEALNHPWITGVSTPSLALESLVFSSLRSFSAKTRFQHQVLRLLTKNIASDELDKLKETFKKMDLDGNGSLTLEEMQIALMPKKVENDEELKVQADEIKKIFESVDLDKNGSISYEELLVAYVHQKVSVKEERLFEVFVAIDTDRSGSLTVDEIEDTLASEGLEIDDIKEMMNEVDEDKNGKIDYEEFLNIMWRRL